MNKMDKITKNIAGFALVLSLLMICAQPARAQYVDPVNDFPNFFENLFQHAATGAEAYMSTMVKTAQDTAHAQSTIDAVDKTVNDNAQMAINMKFTPATGLNGCATAERKAAQGFIQQAQRTLTASISAGAASQGGGTTAASVITNACASGYIDPTGSPDLDQAVNGACKNNYDATRANADVSVSTIDQELKFPESGVKLVGGQLVLPSPSSLNDVKEKAYVDAMNVCINRRGVMPPNPVNQNGGKGTTAANVVAYYNHRMNQLALSPAFTACVNEVNRHTALPQGATQYGTNFANIYNAEQNECKSLVQMGITDPAVTSCTTDGISLSSLERIRKQQYTYPGYHNYLLNKGLDTTEIAKLEEQHEDTNLVSDQLARLNKSMEAVAMNTQPATDTITSNPLDRQKATQLEEQLEIQHQDISQLTNQLHEMTLALRDVVTNAHQANVVSTSPSVAKPKQAHYQGAATLSPGNNSDEVNAVRGYFKASVEEAIEQ